jgi:hypothetical protein
MVDMQKLWLGNIEHGTPGVVVRSWFEDEGCTGISHIRMFHKQNQLSCAIVVFESETQAVFAMNIAKEREHWGLEVRHPNMQPGRASDLAAAVDNETARWRLRQEQEHQQKVQWEELQQAKLQQAKQEQGQLDLQEEWRLQEEERQQNQQAEELRQQAEQAEELRKQAEQAEELRKQDQYLQELRQKTELRQKAEHKEQDELQKEHQLQELQAEDMQQEMLRMEELRQQKLEAEQQESEKKMLEWNNEVRGRLAGPRPPKTPPSVAQIASATAAARASSSSSSSATLAARMAGDEFAAFRAMIKLSPDPPCSNYTEEEHEYMRTLTRIMDAKKLKTVLNDLIKQANKRKEELEGTDIDIHNLRDQVRPVRRRKRVGAYIESVSRESSECASFETSVSNAS